ncbi:hypothetical protein K523DRAFT_320860 [Schizophyllum commune Tattone D]|nr:hypothetical protein K523DRAFT_320860 [Schizophyllum commune Tattone D]
MGTVVLGTSVDRERGCETFTVLPSTDGALSSRASQMQAQGSLRVSSQDMQLLVEGVQLLSPPVDAQSHALSTRA